MYFRLFASALALSFIAGCASVQPVVGADAAMDPNAGYVSGQFTRMKLKGYAFVIQAVDGGAEFVMPLGEDSSLPKEVKSQTVAIKLPPGRCTVSKWITYATLTKEVISRHPVKNVLLSAPFSIVPGGVVSLGSYDVSESVDRSQYRAVTHLQIRPFRAMEADLKSAFASTYPNLASQPFRCLLCVDTVARPASP